MAEDSGDNFAMIEQMLAAVFGAETAARMVAQMRAAGIDPTSMPLTPGTFDPATTAQVMGQLQSFFSTSSGPVNWTIAQELARTSAREDDHRVMASRAAELRQALTQADLWLDPVTALACGTPNRYVWNRENWVEGTFGVWEQLCEPVALNATRAISQALEEQLRRAGMDLSTAEVSAAVPGLGPLMGPMAPAEMVEKMASGLFGMQLGQAIGGLAREALGSSDIGIPLGSEHAVALVDPNVEAFAKELGTPQENVEAFLAVREAAHARLFGAAPWLRAHVIDAVRRYANEITLDSDAIEQAMRDAMTEGTEGGFNPERIAKNLGDAIFSPDPTPAQEQALEELETTMAVIEGWVEEVTTRACAPFIPETYALSEMMRRRRASGSPAEQVLHTLVGLQMRPKRARDAQALWAQLTSEIGIEERDRLWDHPSVMPQAADLDDPASFTARRESVKAEQADVDQELAELLGGTLGYASGLEPGAESEGDHTVTSGPDTDDGPAGPGDAGDDLT